MLWWILSALLLLFIGYLTYAIFLSKDTETNTSLDDFIVKAPGKSAAIVADLLHSCPGESDMQATFISGVLLLFHKDVQLRVFGSGTIYWL